MPVPPPPIAERCRSARAPIQASVRGGRARFLPPRVRQLHQLPACEAEEARRRHREHLALALTLTLTLTHNGQEFLDENFPEKKKGATTCVTDTIWKMREQPPFPFEQTAQDEGGSTVEVDVEEEK